MVMVFNPSGNGNVWWAGYGTDVPQVGVGIPIPEGTSANLYCTDTNQISFIPEVDGNQIYIIAFASGTSVPITPSNPPPFSTTPPTLSPLSPSTNAATNIPVFQPIVIQASEALDGTTISPSTISLSPHITGTVSIDSSNPRNIIIYPTTNMTVSTTYTITVSTSIADLNGNTLASPYTQTFTTASTVGTPDTTPPTIVSSNPIPFATSFSPSNAPTITFSEAIYLPSVTSTNVTAFITNNNQQINNLVFSVSNDMKTLIISNMNMVQSLNYQINIIGGSTGLTDLSGNHFTTTYNIPFATSAPPGNILYSVSGNTYDILQSSSSYIESCIYLNSARSLLVGQIPTNYTFILKRVGSPTGNVVFVWERIGAFGFYSDFRTLKTIAASSISTVDQIITIDDSANTSALMYQDLISIRYQSGNSSNYILAKISNYDAFDSSNTCSLKTNFLDNDSVFTTSDLAGTITVIPQ